jgi:hypothetical protein
VHSWTAAITLHLHRLATSLGLDPNSPVVVGLDSFVQGLKSLDGWTGWVGEELGARIGWDKIRVRARSSSGDVQQPDHFVMFQQETVKAAVEPVRQNLGLLTDVDFLDEVRLSLITSSLDLTPSISDTVRQHSRHRDGVPR